jgi:hypothetical protein
VATQLRGAAQRRRQLVALDLQEAQHLFRRPGGRGGVRRERGVEDQPRQAAMTPRSRAQRV